MSGAHFPRPVRSLAAIVAGETVEIRRILFDAVRGLCTDLGVSEGDVVRCRADTPSHLLLDTPAGRTVALERDWARFIQVGAAGLDAPLDASGDSESESEEETSGVGSAH